jgi:hypothetical protein
MQPSDSQLDDIAAELAAMNKANGVEVTGG